ncbi:hypothetical protein OIU84_017596 [Salix udensis]|uniref:Uncharacterized protein n=1 Tax=Salix udensis TaxID=889485 RepID=A0AAD6L3E3_9ROSI|nr:hypothetical protein OIU84_017596 [Salix udensis]
MLRLFNTQPDMKVVYIAPLKAIVGERMNDWRKHRVAQLGKKMKEVMKSRNKDLVELFESGAGVHHAGMLRADRGTCLHSNFGMG